MASKSGLSKTMGFLLIAVAAFFLISGCKTMDFNTSSASSGPKPAKPDPSPVYYDFDDVLVPQELELDKNNCFVYRASGISAGVLVLDGRVEVNSLITFFENNMIKDNWALVSVVRSPRSLMLFKKENRTCVITVKTTQFTTNVEIWVAPGSGMSPGTGLLKESGLAE